MKPFCFNSYCEHHKVLCEDGFRSLTTFIRPRVIAIGQTNDGLLPDSRKKLTDSLSLTFNSYTGPHTIRICVDCFKLIENSLRELAIRTIEYEPVESYRIDEYVFDMFKDYYYRNNVAKHYKSWDGILGEKVKFLNAGLNPNYVAVDFRPRPVQGPRHRMIIRDVNI